MIFKQCLDLVEGCRWSCAPLPCVEWKWKGERGRGASELEGTLVALEEKLYDLKVTDRGQDRVRFPTRLAGRIAYLANAVSVSDFRPTDQHREVHQVLKDRLNSYQLELDKLLENELPAFNRTLRERNLPTVLTGGES